MSYTVSDIGEGELEIKRSKFIGLVYPIASRNDVNSILADVRRKYANASHIIYAYRIGVNGAMEYYTDAGEPSGTAGAPILKLLSSMNVSNTLVVVVRYFGGTKLGTGGLVKAFLNSAFCGMGAPNDLASILPFLTRNLAGTLSTPKASKTDVSTRATGKITPRLSTMGFISSAGSYVTASTASLSYFFASSLICFNSTLHGPHQLATNDIIPTTFEKSLSVNFLPSKSVATNLGIFSNFSSDDFEFEQLISMVKINTTSTKKAYLTALVFIFNPSISRI